jgi:hypothetical protein
MAARNPAACWKTRGVRVASAFAFAALCDGCASHEVANFQARAGQESIVRDGRPALVSRANNSIVMIAPAVRQFRSGGRPVFVVGIYNLSQAPLGFRVADISATQTVKDLR